VPEPFLLNEESIVEIRFNSLLEGEECPAEAFDAPFQVTFNAPEDVTFQATWDGLPVRLNLLMADPDEALTDEFYFKG
jgi:hypothetical protein